MSPGLLRVAERAKRNPDTRLLALAHHIDEPALIRAYGRLRKDAAEGVDGVTVEQFGQQLDDKVRALHQRMKAGQYRHQPIRRVHIPKEGAKTRPIGISTVEDKIVQSALREVLEVVYEQAFLACSYGFRPGRSAHGAIRTSSREMWPGAVNVVLEADIVSFFDSISRGMLMEMLRARIADESLMRLIGKCLKVGVLDGEEYSEPAIGTSQGSALSPLMGNIYACSNTALKSIPSDEARATTAPVLASRSATPSPCLTVNDPFRSFRDSWFSPVRLSAHARPPWQCPGRRRCTWCITHNDHQYVRAD
jgi:RNA-directed DNA polymerase